jgi:glucose/arabinose dehydrogenase/mono/diheme cytochrome c family protein
MRYITFVLLIACCSVFVFWGTKEQAAVSFPIEERFVLDSTIIGTSTIASGLDVPWEITWGPDNHIWMTEQGGTVSRLNPKNGKIKILLKLPDVYRKRTMGLLGMAVSGDLTTNPYVFLDYTFLDGINIRSRLARYTYRNDTLVDPIVLLNDIPGSNGHNGSRITLAPDGKLMMSTGDAQVFANAQNKTSVNGKVLRINIDGTIPTDNPVSGSPVWSWGHRNIQGLAYGSNGILYSSEHGDAIEDEINIIQRGANYGWPNVEGLVDRDEEKTFVKTTRVTEPIKSWTPTIAPAGIGFYNSSLVPEWKNSLLLTTLKGSSLYVLKLEKNGKKVVCEKIYFNQSYGRIRDVCVSPTGEIYISTSNRDWNPSEGYPKPKDDRIIRITKIRTDRKAAIVKRSSPIQKPVTSISGGNLIYTNYCASCHKRGGEGVTGNFPPLNENPRVTGDKEALISVVLNGLSGPIKVKGVEYNQAMPAFKFLSDKDIAGVVSYIRTNLGNQAGAVTIGDVSKVRNAKK